MFDCPLGYRVVRENNANVFARNFSTPYCLPSHKWALGRHPSLSQKSAAKIQIHPPPRAFLSQQQWHNLSFSLSLSLSVIQQQQQQQLDSQPLAWLGRRRRRRAGRLARSICLSSVMEKVSNARGRFSGCRSGELITGSGRADGAK